MPQPTSSSAMDAAFARIELAARRSAFHIVKQRARHFRKNRLGMSVLDQRLPFASPRALIAIGEHLVETSSRKPTGSLVQFAPVSIANARAVLLLGRFERRFSARLQEAA